MGTAIRDCPRQIEHILDSYEKWSPQLPGQPPKQVLFLGMGGSAIGGDMVRVWVERSSMVPMWVLRGYDVPAWVGPGTLVLASSYSGETEETLSAVRQAAQRGARVVAVASGGELSRLTEAEGWANIAIPGGLQPRAAIGYSLAAVARVLVAFKVLEPAVLEELRSGAGQMAAEGECWGDPDHPQNEPLRLAKAMGDTLPVIYGAVGTTEALAVRLRGQLAENSKLLASHHLLPELNHNEIVGLAQRLKDPGGLLVIWLADADDHARVILRRKLTSRLVGVHRPAGAPQSGEYTMEGRGSGLIQRNLSLLHQIDWLSYYAALLRGWDPSVIEVLTDLKKELRQA